MNYLDTIVALATPSGAGAIGIIRLSGPEAISIASNMFVSISGKKLQEQKTHTVHLGHIILGDRILDEVLATIFKNPHSYTGEDVVEFSCHGSDFIKQEIIQYSMDSGCRMASPGEFTQRAFLNGKMDLSQAEAVADLIASESKAEHQIAIQQMKGGFSEDLKVLRDKLINFTALIELELDFTEEDVEFANRDELNNLISEIEIYLSTLAASFKLGNAIKNGINTTIVGRPNAGKSTLLNALLNEERAIVSSIAGTTRDTIEEILNIEGISFRFIDTAGLRKTNDEIEKIGVERALENVNKSAVYIYLFDIAELSVEDVIQDLSELPQNIPRVVVANKSDIVSEEILKTFKDSEIKFIFISAKTK
jgi:tRNA modification GTPase